jgi:hypothetical protein
VGIIVEDIEDDVRPSTALPLGLPEEFAEWVSHNAEFITRIQQGLRSSYAEELTPQKLMGIILTASNDPAFVQAQHDMQEAKKELDLRDDPLNKPLGLIGRALESEELSGVRKRYDDALASYTIISEGLLEHRPDLAKLLNVLLVQKRMIDQSIARTRKILEAAKELAELISLKRGFNRRARKSSILSRQFESLFNRKKQPIVFAKSTLPWLPGV